MKLTSNVIISILITVILLIIIIYYNLKNKRHNYNIGVEKGNFIFLNPNEWQTQPYFPLSKNSQFGIPTFKSDRYSTDNTDLPYLYGGRKIKQNEAWIIKGNVPNSVIYWSFGAYLLHDGVNDEFIPIEAPINNKMISSTKDDDIICIISPSTKFAEFLADKIRHEEYTLKNSERNIVFRYFCIPNYNAAALYNLMFMCNLHEDSSLPEFEVVKYTHNEKDKFPVGHVMATKHYIYKNKKTIDEYELMGSKELAIKKFNSLVVQYKQKVDLNILGDFNRDVLYLTSPVINLKKHDKVVVVAANHSGHGKCLYSEILFIDAESGKVISHEKIGRFNAINTDKTVCKTKVIQPGFKLPLKLKIMEIIGVDLSTKLKPLAEI